MRRLRTPLLPGLLVAAALTALGCSSAEERQEIEVESVTAALEAYLPRLGEAYASGDLEPLEGLAAQKEIAAIEKRISDLAEQGRILEPTFRDVTVEDLRVFNYANAYVSTVEIWDIRSLSTGSREQLAELIGHRDRVKYQLKREGDSWRVLFRAIQE